MRPQAGAKVTSLLNASFIAIGVANFKQNGRVARNAGGFKKRRKPRKE